MNYTYIYVALLGVILKIYDDVTDLYLLKNARVLECIKTLWTVLWFSCVFYISSNGYDVLWMLFFVNFLSLADWDAYTSDPYFFSLVFFNWIFCLITIYVKKYSFNYNFLILINLMTWEIISSFKI